MGPPKQSKTLAKGPKTNWLLLRAASAGAVVAAA